MSTDIFEFGANALLVALIKEGQHVNNDGTSPYGMVLAKTLRLGEKGWLVFIPEEES